MKLQTIPELALLYSLFGKRQMACPDLVGLCDYLQKTVESTYMAVWTVIFRTVAYDLAGLEYTRELLFGNAY